MDYERMLLWLIYMKNVTRVISGYGNFVSLQNNCVKNIIEIKYVLIK